MNFAISVLFRAIPLAMGAVCLGYGLYIGRHDDPNSFVAGHVNISLTAICFALFTTAATIIRQLIGRYNPVWRIVLPLSGYAVALATIAWGITVVRDGDESKFVVAGHVIIGVGLIAVCVSTVATSSTAFTLIPVSAAREPMSGPPPHAYSRTVGVALIVIPVACAIAGFALAFSLYARTGSASYVAGHVVLGLAAICASLVALVASIVRQIRNVYAELERYRWSWLVVAMGLLNVILGLVVLFGSDKPYRIAPGCILIGLGLVCFSIMSKALLLGLVWRQSFPLANRIPIIPVVTALACLFFAAFLFEAATTNAEFFIPARVLVGLGAVCFTLFSIVSILEAGTSG